MGLAASVAMLRAIESTGVPETVLAVWPAVQTLHVLLRYQSFAVLRFPELNYKRAGQLAMAYVRGHRIPGCVRDPLAV